MAAKNRDPCWSNNDPRPNNDLWPRPEKGRRLRPDASSALVSDGSQLDGSALLEGKTKGAQEEWLARQVEKIKAYFGDVGGE